MTPVLMALGGGSGAALRFVVDGFVGRRVRWVVPLGTVVINVGGSFLLGLLSALAVDVTGLGSVKLVLGTGVLGGYTTFSTASVEAVNLALAEGMQATVLAVLHAVGMLLLSLAAAGLGLWLG